MKTIRDRILFLLEEKEITKTEFASKLNITQAYVSKITNKGAIPSDRLIEDICEKFGVNESWLRTGEGEMFSEVPAEDEYFKAVTQISKSNDKLAMQAIIEYWKLDDVSKETLKNYIYKIAEKSRE